MANYADPGTFSITEPSKLQPGALLVLVSGIVALGFCLFGFLYLSSTRSQTDNLRVLIQEDQTKLASLAPVSESLTRYDLLAKNLTTLFSAQKHWGDVLQVVESRLYKNMKVTSLQITDAGVLTLSGVTPNYTEYAGVYSSLISDFAKENITNVQVLSVSANEGKEASGVTFSFQAQLTKKALLAGSL